MVVASQVGRQQPHISSTEEIHLVSTSLSDSYISQTGELVINCMWRSQWSFCSVTPLLQCVAFLVESRIYDCLACG